MATRNIRDASNQSRPDNRGGQQQGLGFADMENGEQGKIAITGGEAVSGGEHGPSGINEQRHDAGRQRPETPKRGENPAWMSASSDRDVRDKNSSGPTRDSAQTSRDIKRHRTVGT